MLLAPHSARCVVLALVGLRWVRACTGPVVVELGILDHLDSVDMEYCVRRANQDNVETNKRDRKTEACRRKRGSALRCSVGSFRCSQYPLGE